MVIKTMRPHPILYEINTRVWLRELIKKHGNDLTLGTIPDSEWLHLQKLGFDCIWLMGVWKPSLQGTRIATCDDNLQKAYDKVLPEWQADDIIGSPYAISAYEINPLLGKQEELTQVRDKLHNFGMRLILDFVPNHMAVDHPWIWSHPDYFIIQVEQRNPELFFEVTNKSQKYFIAHGKDPYFGPWTDTAQLNYFNPETRRAMVQILNQISEVCDGVRCDMTMLVLNNNFRNIWRDYLGEWRGFEPAMEFWQEAISSAKGKNPNFIFIAEDYWGRESSLYHQRLGFDYLYDEELYKCLLDLNASDIKTYLYSDSNQDNIIYHRHSFRFIENHDKERAITAFGIEKSKAAAVIFSTLMGMRQFHQGQLKGNSIQIPVQLKRVKEQSCVESLAVFYRTLLTSINAPCFHYGDWHWLDARAVGYDQSYQNLISWYWSYDHSLKLIVVNYAEHRSQGWISMPNLDDFDETLVLWDELNHQSYQNSKADIASKGLYIALDAFQFHLFDISDKVSS